MSIKEKVIFGIMMTLNKEEDYYESKRVRNVWNNNYIEYESNGDKNRNLSLDEYRNKIKTYLRYMIINLQDSAAQNIQLTIEINSISSKVLKKSV